LKENKFHHSTYRVLALAYGLAGEGEKGHAVVCNLLELDPKFSVSQYRARSPASRAETYAQVLRDLGAPE